MSRVSAEVGGETLWFESAEAELFRSPEGFGSALLVPAMSHGRDLVFEDPLEPVWLENVRKIIIRHSEWWGWRPISITSLSEGAPPPRPAGEKRVLCFSGGADSFYSLLTYPEPIDTLMFVHGYDVALADERGGQLAFDHVKQVGAGMGIEAVRIRSNYREHSIAGRKYKHAYGGALCGAGHLLVGYDELVISSGFRHEEALPHGTHWEVDPWWSSQSMKVVHYGATHIRDDKVREIAASPLFQKHVRVCQENMVDRFELSAKFINCGRCQKCVRTLLVMQQEVGLNHIEGFENTVDLHKWIDEIDMPGDYLVKAYLEICRHGVDAQCKRSIKDMLHRCHVLGRVPKWAGRRGRSWVFNLLRLRQSIRRCLRRGRQALRPIRRSGGRLWRRFFRRRIPVAMITGTKGKTTATRMLSHILSVAGHRVGFSCTDGVVVEGEYIHRGDSAGYKGAQAVLAHKNITAAVLETARGGLLRTGPYIDRCNVAALLNVGREQIGIDGVDSVEQMARVKQRVIHAASDTVVLNADDEQCVRLISDYPARRVILFSMEKENPVVQRHVEASGVAFQRRASPEQDCIVRCEGDFIQPLLSVADLPSCREGMFPQNIENAMAAAALADGMAVPQEDIRRGLKTFENSIELSPGRFNFIEGYSQTILLDYAAQPPAGVRLVESLKKLHVYGKRVCMFYTVGNRPNWHYTEMTAALAPNFDHFICYELKSYRRGRAPGEISKLLCDGLKKAGVSPEQIALAQGYDMATRKLLDIAGKDDLLVILMADSHDYLPVFKKVFG